MKTTEKFSLLPNIAGVHFDGFENFLIPSRENVKNKIQDFLQYCIENAKATATAVIIGEWGEGKTEAYHLYIKSYVESNDTIPLYISASTLANCYSNTKSKDLVDSTPLMPLKLLVALFSGIRAETNSSEIKRKIPDPEKFDKGEEFVEETLQGFLETSKNKKIFIFIDEFEELLLNKNSLKQIISGIKETINGQYHLIHEHGKYEGSIHFLISCTPDAYYGLQSDRETSLIFGGLGRRINVIELPEIRKNEGINYLFALLKYSFKGNLPKISPIENLGVFNLLLKVSQGNLGIITNLYSRAFSSLIKNDKILVLDTRSLLNFLENEQIFVYGGQSPCIEKELYSRIISTLKDQKNVETGKNCENVFNLLLGENTPFSINEISNRLNLTKTSVLNSIHIINEQLKNKEQIDNSIIKVSKVKESKKFDDILTVFNPYLMNDSTQMKKIIKIDNYSETLVEFEDRISQGFIKNDQIINSFFLPVDTVDVLAFFEGINSDHAREISNMLKQKLIDQDPYYIIGPQIMFQIFPTPVPKGLEYIKNRELRMKIWREVSRDLSNQYGKYISDSLIEFLNISELYSISIIENTQKYHIIKLQDKRDETELTVLFYFINGDLKAKDVEDMYHIYKTKCKIHLIIPFYTGEITPDALDKIKFKEIGKEGTYSILTDFYLHPTLVKRIIGGYRARNESEENVDLEIYHSICKKIIVDELIFDSKLIEWIKKQEENGLVIPQLQMSVKSLKEFSDALKYFINFTEDANTAEEVFNKNRERILKFRKYGSKSGFLPSEIDSVKTMTERALDLTVNHFLKSSEGKYSVIEHTVEKRIIKILEKEKKVNISDLSEFFIIKTKMKKVIEDVFLNILEYKGIVKKEKDFFTLVDEENSYNELLINIQKFEEEIQKEDYQRYNHLLFIKDQDKNLISLKEFEITIREIKTQIISAKNVKNRKITLQKISLINRLLRQFDQEFKPIILKANQESKSELITVKEKFHFLDSNFESITVNCQKWMNTNLSSKNIHEYNDLFLKLKEMEQIQGKFYEIKEIREIIDRNEKNRDFNIKFKFDKENPADGFYFNIKFYLFQTAHNDFFEKTKKIEILFNNINPIFDELNNLEGAVNSQLKIKDIPEKYRISNLILHALKEQKNINLNEKIPCENEMKLKDIEKMIKHYARDITKKINSKDQSLHLSEEFLENEKNFLTFLDECKTQFTKLQKIFNTPDQKKIFDRINGSFKMLISKYEDYTLTNNVSDNKKTIREAEKFVDSIKSEIDENLKEFESEWTQYRIDTNIFLKKVDEILSLISKKQEINLESINEKCTFLKEKIGQDINIFNDSFSNLEKIKEEITAIAYEELHKILTKEETKVLEVLIAYSGSNQKWTPIKIVIDELGKNGIDPSKSEQIIKNLIKKGYLTPGLSLTI